MRLRDESCSSPHLIGRIRPDPLPTAPPVALALAGRKQLVFCALVGFTLVCVFLFAATYARGHLLAFDLLLLDDRVLSELARRHDATRAFTTRAGLTITPPSPPQPLNATAEQRCSAWKRSEALARFVHQSWKTAQLPPRFSRWSHMWRDCFPNWTHVLWSDEDNERFVREHYAWFLERYRTFKKHIYRVDAVRYMYLHHFGGIYTDLDNLCLRPFEHLLRGRGLVFGDMESGWWFPQHFMYIQNSWMYSRPGHPFWLDLLQAIARGPRDDTAQPEGVTGPWKLMGVLKERWALYENETTVYPPHVYAVLCPPALVPSKAPVAPRDLFLWFFAI